MHAKLMNRSCFSRLVILLCVFILGASGILLASDLSDATAMRQKCEEEFKALDTTVKNFGNPFVKRRYEDAAVMLKEGKLCLAQSKYKEAMEIYKKYMILNNEIYKDLSVDYINRADTMYNDTAKELVDYYDNEKVSHYFRLAKQNVDDARKAASANNYKLAIDLCRNSKKYSIESYRIAGQPVPDKYKKDIKDNNKELYQE
ncbi:MAG TPA: hypothetical protein PK514_11890 [Spirochaetota bacterium]|nr:hypothetical protein [Spirochaetota bacterium]